jgi:hypothetical protein
MVHICWFSTYISTYIATYCTDMDRIKLILRDIFLWAQASGTQGLRKLNQDKSRPLLRL